MYPLPVPINLLCWALSLVIGVPTAVHHFGNIKKNPKDQKKFYMNNKLESISIQ